MIKDSIDPLVSITCITYNHEQFIKQCLDGFLMQRTNFPFEIVLYDDASTDQTSRTIRDYADRNPSIFNVNISDVNQYSRGVRGINAKYNIPRCRGKYIALCEGDDYWTDPYKLQKQVDLLEANPEYSSVFTKYELFCEQEKEIRQSSVFENINLDNYEITLKNFLNPYLIHTSTVLFKYKSIKNKIRNMGSKNYCKDIFLFALFLEEGPGFFLKESTSVYRIHSNGVWSGQTAIKNLESNCETLRHMNRYFQQRYKPITMAYFHQLEIVYKMVVKEKKYFKHFSIIIEYVFMKILYPDKFKNIY
jgi:glycosyltransferase involved in cell wall biosynthesis